MTDAATRICPIGCSPVELVNEMRALPLRTAVMEKWLWRNAARLLKMEIEAPSAPGLDVH